MGEGEGGMIWENGIEICIISYMKRVASPGSRLDTWGWFTGTTQRDGMGREEGGGFRMGNTCILWWIHFYIWQNQYNNVKLKNKIKKKNSNIQKTKIMASGPITSWQIDGETMEMVREFSFGGSKITADGDEIKRCLLLGRKL